MLFNSKGTLCLTITPSISSSKLVFDTYASALNFQWRDGGWSSFADQIKDLDWLDDSVKMVCVFHPDWEINAMDEWNKNAYMSIIQAAAEEGDLPLLFYFH